MQLKKAEREQNNAQSSRFSKRIGSTVYDVSVYFKDGSCETPEDIIFRLVSNRGLQNSPNYGTMNSLQTERLPGGSV